MDFSEIFQLHEITAELKLGLQKSFHWKGYLNRKSFIQFAIGLILLLFVYNAIIGMFDIYIFNMMAMLVNVASIIPITAAISRRHQSLGKNATGYFILFAFTILGFLFLNIYKRKIPTELESFLEQALFGIFIVSMVIPLIICLKEDGDEFV